MDAIILDPSFEFEDTIEHDDCYRFVDWSPENDFVFLQLPTDFASHYFVPVVNRYTCNVLDIPIYPSLASTVACYGYPCQMDSNRPLDCK